MKLIEKDITCSSIRFIKLIFTQRMNPDDALVRDALFHAYSAKNT